MKIYLLLLIFPLFFFTNQICVHLLQILMYFHKHKSQSNVDQMLYRLYQPILWRALKVRICTPHNFHNLALRLMKEKMLTLSFSWLPQSLEIQENLEKSPFFKVSENLKRSGKNFERALKSGNSFLLLLAVCW